MLTDLPNKDIKRLEFFVSKYNMSTKEFITEYESNIRDSKDFDEWYALVIKGVRKL